MKCMIVFSALVALSTAGYAPLAYSAYNPLALGYSAYAPSIYSQTIVQAPSVVGHPSLYAAPAFYNAPAVAAPAVIAAPAVVAAPAGVKTQYHAQDELGQASYGHSEPTQTHTAVQDAHGNKVGSFSYVSPDGRVLRTDYVADALGYRVESNALPVGPGAGPAAVVDTPEVVAARAAHLALHGRAKRSLVALGHTPAATAPLATHVIAPAYHAPLAYSAPVAPFAYSNVVSHAAVAPLAYSNVVSHAPVAYSAAVAPAPLLREATLTTVVNNPGHAVSYRVD